MIQRYIIKKNKHNNKNRNGYLKNTKFNINNKNYFKNYNTYRDIKSRKKEIIIDEIKKLPINKINKNG